VKNAIISSITVIGMRPIEKDFTSFSNLTVFRLTNPGNTRYNNEGNTCVKYDFIRNESPRDWAGNAIRLYPRYRVLIAMKAISILCEIVNLQLKRAKANA